MVTQEREESYPWNVRGSHIPHNHVTRNFYLVDMRQKSDR